MIKLTRGQMAVLAATAIPMAAVGIAGAIATFVNMKNVLSSGATALGMVAAGEGATLICALVSLAVTLMGQHTPATIRAGLWLLPLTASGAGIYLAADGNHAVAMGFTPLAMTAAGEGIALVARRIVAYRTNVDLEQQRRSGLLLWHSNRAANGNVFGRWASRAAVWRLTKGFATTDAQMSVQLGEIQRYRISEGADANLAAVLSGKKAATPRKAVQPPVAPPAVPAPPTAPQLPAAPVQVVTGPPVVEEDFDFARTVLTEAEQAVADDQTVKLLTVAEVAAIKGVAAGTVRSWVNRNKLPVAARDEDGRSLFHPLAVADLD